MARILLGVTGGIAAYKALELVRLAMRAGHAVRVIQTRAAQEFVGPVSFAGITGAPVLSTEWEPDPLRGAFPGDPMPAHAPLSHLALVDAADVYLIAPATAHTLARLAAGLADDLLTAAALACRRPLVVAPAMNDAMWGHAATQANVATLRARGVRVLEPGVGALGSIGEWGAGRLPEPPELLSAVEAVLSGAAGERAGARDLDGLRVLVTAGGTREPIDAVRFIGNRSSGRMGFALAEQAAARGAEVTVVAANVALPRLQGVRYVDVGSAAELKAAAEAHFPGADILLMAAAVADFRPARAHDGKIKKPVDDPSSGLRVELERTEDVLGALAARRRPDQVLVGFAAEHGAGAVEYGRGKLERKNLDLVVVNDVSDPRIGFDARENEVVILARDSDPIHVPRTSKAAVARAILDAALSCSSSSLETVR
jgi:phosphopantothenoylcysteine decarboxylase/phosphopantothenate--cysteine ligase